MVGETINNDLKQIITSLGGSPEGLEDNLLSTKLNKIIELLQGGSGGGGSSYSTDETAVGIFLGKPLYRKVIPCNMVDTKIPFISQTWVKTSAWTVPSDVDYIVNSKAISLGEKNANGSQEIPLNTNLRTDGLYYTCPIGNECYNPYLIIEYIKKTD